MRTTDKPEHGNLVTATELGRLIGVSNVRVVTHALARLGVAPVVHAAGSISVYRNGGSGRADWKTPLYDPAIAAVVEGELRKNAKATGEPGKVRYDDISFRWRPAAEAV